MTTKKKYIIVGFFALLIIGGLGGYNYIYKDHRDIAAEKVDFELKPPVLLELMSNSLEAKKYTDKVIKTYGTITSIEQNSIILDNKTQVNFKIGDVSKLSLGAEVIVKGRCVGYDDLLELVKIDQATILN